MGKVEILFPQRTPSPNEIKDLESGVLGQCGKKDAT